jgi:Uma2 family endonuclease
MLYRNGEEVTPMSIQNPKRPISIDDYHRMAADGLFSGADRVELIEGEIVEMTPAGDLHCGGVRRLDDLFTTALGRRVLVDKEHPVRLGDLSEPEPDLALLVRRDDYYASRTPVPADVFLLVEVADSSTGYDRSVKAPLYVRAGIREYWLLDLPAGILEVYRQPRPDGCRDVRRLHRWESVAVEAFPDVQFSVSDLLGPDRAR